MAGKNEGMFCNLKSKNVNHICKLSSSGGVNL